MSNYLKKADENLPRLYKSLIKPKYKERVLSSGDTVILDLGNHYVGYFSFKMWYVDEYIDAPVRMNVRFCEVKRELDADYSDYRSRQTRGSRSYRNRGAARGSDL